MSGPDQGAIAEAVRALLVACGLDPTTDPDLLKTADRVSRSWMTEFVAGYGMDPARILGDPVLGEADPDVVVLTGLRFHAMCPHHLLPYRGTRGAGVVLEAEQLCLAIPGEKHDSSAVTTSAFLGEMAQRPDLKARLHDDARRSR